MGSFIIDRIISVIENFIYDATTDAYKCFWQRRKRNNFLKEVKQDIINFCRENETTYIGSSAFENFLSYNKPLDRIMQNAIAGENSQSIDILTEKLIDEAQVSAEKGDRRLSIDDRRVVKELCSLVDQRINHFCYSILTPEQRYIVSTNSRNTAKLQESIEKASKGNHNDLEKLKLEILVSNRLSDYRAEPIAELICKKMWLGSFKEIEDLLPLVMTKSNDIDITVELMQGEMFHANTTIIRRNQLLSNVNNPIIRSIIIRNIIPLLYFRNEKIDNLTEFVSSETLKNIITSLEEEEYSVIFTEDISNMDGINAHVFTINKQYMAEEEWLVKHILAVYLYKMNFPNSAKVIETIIDPDISWFASLILFDKKVDLLQYEGFNGENKSRIADIQSDLRSKKDIYDLLADDYRAIYYSLLLKATFCLQNEDIHQTIDIIPRELYDIKPIKDFLYMAQISDGTANFDELNEYCRKNEEYWLMTNYLLHLGNSKDVVEVLLTHQELLKSTSAIFFIFVENLVNLHREEDAITYLINYKEYYKGFFDYWNLYLSIDSSKKVCEEFLLYCKDNDFNFFGKKSEHIIVERLLSMNEFTLAEKYIKRLEMQQGELPIVKKYKAFVLYGNNKNIEALELFKSIFDDYATDSKVINAIISISLSMKRKIDDKYINAAKSIKTPRMYLLAAAAYASNGNFIDARRNNLRAILASDDVNNPAFMQYLNLDFNYGEDTGREITCVENDTSVTLKEINSKEMQIYCIYNDKVLIESPYIWHEDKHIYVEDAAELGIYRKAVGDMVEIAGINYLIEKIVPLDYYFSRITFESIVKNGSAKTIQLPSIDGQLDVEAFVEQLKEFTPDQKDQIDWIEQYNNFEDAPLPLFMYKRFYNVTYTQFIETVLEEKKSCIREIVIRESVKPNRYILSFVSLIILKKIGIPSNLIKETNTFIAESTQLQIHEDVSEIISGYAKNNVSTMGIYDGKPYLFEADSELKNKWIKEAGEIKKYVDNIPTVLNTHDLGGKFFDQLEAIELFGIPDYDTISISLNEDYTVVTTEAMMSSLKQNQDVKLNAINLTQWLINANVNCVDLVKYVHEMIKLGCVKSITEDLVLYLIRKIIEIDEESIIQLYEVWDALLAEYGEMSEIYKPYAVQLLTELYARIHGKVDDPASCPIILIMVRHLLSLHNIKYRAEINSNGELEIVRYQALPDEGVDKTTID